MDKDQSLSQWVAEITGSDSWRTVAEKLSTTHSTIKRRLSNRESDAIIELAAAYGANPISGLIAAGSISRADVMAYAGDLTVEQLSDVELARIMVKRLEEEESRRGNTHTQGNDYDDGTVRNFDWSEPHTADSSLDENAPREERGCLAP